MCVSRCDEPTQRGERSHCCCVAVAEYPRCRVSALPFDVLLWLLQTARRATLVWPLLASMCIHARGHSRVSERTSSHAVTFTHC